MKIHFMSAVIDGNTTDYEKIINAVEQLGHEIVTKHVLERRQTDLNKESPAEAELYAKKVHVWIKKSDAVIFETTKPDVSIGFEVATALNLGKPVIILYRKDIGDAPHALKGIDSEKLQVLGYDMSTLDELMQVALDYAQESVDVRFNFFISPSISHYLDWVSQNKKLPRSVYLRNLIEKEMAENDEYLGSEEL